MSYKNQKSLVVVASIVAALLAGTVLLGGYAKSVPAKSETDSPMQATGCCPMMGAQAAQEGEVSCPQAAKASFNVDACPMERTESCCEENPPQEPCPADCPKPCCAKEAATSGCADSADAAGACCPATTSTATK